MFYWTLVHERYDVGPNVSRSQPPALWVCAGNMNWKIAQKSAFGVAHSRP